MARARVPAAMPYVSSVSCWLSPLLREYSGLTLYLKNQHFQIQTRPGMVEEEPLGGCATSKSLFIYLFIYFSLMFFQATFKLVPYCVMLALPRQSSFSVTESDKI